MSRLYSAGALPDFVPGTENLLAQPRHLRFICVLAPKEATINIVPSGDPVQTHTHLDEGEQGILPHNDAEPHVHLREGDVHMLVGLDGVHMVAPDALLEGEGATYSIIAEVLASSDPHAAYLRGLWVQFGVRPRAMEIMRTALLHVVGQVPENSECTGKRFRGGNVRYYTLEPLSFVVRNHDGTMAVVNHGIMRRMFGQLVTQDGTVRRVFM